MNDSMSATSRGATPRRFGTRSTKETLTFQLADQFADWWMRIGWLMHRDDIAAGFEEWRRERKQ